MITIDRVVIVALYWFIHLTNPQTSRTKLGKMSNNRRNAPNFFVFPAVKRKADSPQNPQNDDSESLRAIRTEVMWRERASSVAVGHKRRRTSVGTAIGNSKRGHSAPRRLVLQSRCATERANEDGAFAEDANFARLKAERYVIAKRLWW